MRENKLARLAGVDDVLQGHEERQREKKWEIGHGDTVQKVECWTMYEGFCRLYGTRFYG